MQYSFLICHVQKKAHFTIPFTFRVIISQNSSKVMGRILSLNYSSSRYVTHRNYIYHMTNILSMGTNSFKPLDFIRRRILGIHSAIYFNTNSGTDDNQPKRKRSKETVELITLLDSSNNPLGVKSKTEAEVLAKKHNKSLIKLDGQSFGKKYPVYKLSSNADYFENRKSKANKNTVRESKKLTVSCRISDHDLHTKLKTVRKWLSKNCEIQFVITGAEGKEELLEQKYKIFEEELKTEARLFQKRIDNGILKFGAIPPKKDKLPSLATEPTKSTMSDTSELLQDK